MKKIFNEIRNKVSQYSDRACFMPDNTMVVSENRINQILDEAVDKWEIELKTHNRKVRNKAIEEFSKKLKECFALHTLYNHYHIAEGINSVEEKLKKEVVSDIDIREWIPVGQTLPYPGEVVQVTYKGHISGELLCDAMAFIDSNGDWHWDDGEDSFAGAEITAWRHPGEPYKGEGFEDKE